MIIPVFDHYAEFIDLYLMVSTTYVDKTFDYRLKPYMPIALFPNLTSINAVGEKLVFGSYPFLIEWGKGFRRLRLPVALDLKFYNNKYYIAGYGTLAIADSTGKVLRELVSYTAMFCGELRDKLIITIDDINNNVIVVDVETGNLVASFRVENAEDATFDGTYIYVSCNDHYVRKYDLYGNFIAEYPIFAISVKYMNGKFYARELFGNKIKIYDSNFNLIKTLTFDFSIHSFTPLDNGNIVVGRADGRLYLVDEDGNTISTYDSGTSVYILSYNAGRIIQADIVNHAVHIYDVNLNKINTITHNYLVFPTFVGYDGTYYHIYSRYGYILVFDEEGNLVNAYSGNYFSSIDVYSNIVAVGDQITGTLYLFDNNLNLIKYHQFYSIGGVFFKGDTLYVYDKYTRTIYILEPPYDTYTSIKTFDIDYEAIRWKNNYYIAWILYEGILHVLDEEFNIVYEYKYPPNTVYDYIVDGVVVGNHLYVLHNGYLKKVDMKTNETVTVFSTFNVAPYYVLSHISGLIVCTTTIEVFYVYDRVNVRLEDRVTKGLIVYPAPDNKVLIAGEDGEGEKVWLFDGKNLEEIYRRSKNISSAVLLNDGTLFVYDAVDGELVMVKNGVEQVIAHDFWIYSMAPSHDHSKAYLATDDGIYELYPDGTYKKISNLIAAFYTRTPIYEYYDTLGGITIRIAGKEFRVESAQFMNMIKYYGVPYARKQDRIV